MSSPIWWKFLIENHFWGERRCREHVCKSPNYSSCGRQGHQAILPSFFLSKVSSILLCLWIVAGCILVCLFSRVEMQVTSPSCHWSSYTLIRCTSNYLKVTRKVPQKNILNVHDKIGIHKQHTPLTNNHLSSSFYSAVATAMFLCLDMPHTCAIRITSWQRTRVHCSVWHIKRSCWGITPMKINKYYRIMYLHKFNIMYISYKYGSMHLHT